MTSRNKIPVHWEISALEKDCIIIQGQSPPSNTYNNSGEGIPFFQGKADFTDLHPIVRKWCNAPQKIALPNDILLSVRAPVGTTNIADQKCCIGRGLAAIRAKNYKFVFYFLRSIEHKLDNKGTGTTFRAISGNVVRNISIPIPPASEQKLIVEKIEELFSELDAGRRQLEAVKKQLETYRQSVLHQAFTGRLVKTGRDLSYASPPICQNKNKLTQLPEGWRCTKLKDVCIKIVGGGTPSTSISKYWSGDIPWISSADIFGIRDIRPRRKISEEAVNNSATNILPKGGIIVVTRVGLGKVAIAPVDMCFSQDNQGMILDENLVNKDYALHFLQKSVQEFKYQSRGTTINGVTKKQLSDLKFFSPPVREQGLIVQEIESRLSVCDKLEETIETCLQQTEALKQSILKQAFEGKLVKSPNNC